MFFSSVTVICPGVVLYIDLFCTLLYIPCILLAWCNNVDVVVIVQCREKPVLHLFQHLLHVIRHHVQERSDVFRTQNVVTEACQKYGASTMPARTPPFIELFVPAHRPQNPSDRYKELR